MKHAQSHMLWTLFITELFNPKKKYQYRPKKSPTKRAWSNPHQGKQERARRIAQMNKGMIPMDQRRTAL